MALTNTQLLTALGSAIRSADQGGNTSAADVRGFLTNLLAYIQEGIEPIPTKADLVSGKVPAAQLPTRDPYAVQDNAAVVAAVTGGTYTDGELQASSPDYATAMGALVAPGDRIVRSGFVHEYCRLADGSLGWVRWAKS